MKAQIAGLMKQAQQMQENMRKLQDELASIEVEGQSGAGMVKVTMTCRHDVKRVSIDPSLLADDKDMLEDLVAAAVNDARRGSRSLCTGRCRASAAAPSATASRSSSCAPCAGLRGAIRLSFAWSKRRGICS